jgi:hypothetical protein
MEPTTNFQTPAPHQNKRAGTIAGLVFLLLLLLIGLFLYGMRLNREQDINVVETPTSEVTDDDLNDIQADLETFDLESLETESPEVDSTLETEL